MDDLYTLDDLSKRLGGIPISTLKHRIQQLGVPAAARGARNKLLFEPATVELLSLADQLIRDGQGIATIRRTLKLGDQPVGEEPVAVAVVPAAETAEGLDRLSRTLERALGQLAEKDRQLEQLNEELRRAVEAAATFQQKTFYLQGELQRLQGELRDARSKEAESPQGGKGPRPWRLWKKDP